MITGLFGSLSTSVPHTLGCVDHWCRRYVGLVVLPLRWGRRLRRRGSVQRLGVFLLCAGDEAKRQEVAGTAVALKSNPAPPPA